MLRVEYTSVLARVGSYRERANGPLDLCYFRQLERLACPPLLNAVPESLRGNDLEDPPAIEDDAQVAHPVDAPELVARHFLDAQARFGDADIHHGLDLEADAIEAKGRQMPGPERVIAVTQVGVPGAEGQVHHAAQDPVAQLTGQGDVVAAAAVGEAGSLGGVGPADEGGDEPGDLGTVGRAIAVDHDDNVA